MPCDTHLAEGGLVWHQTTKGSYAKPIPENISFTMKNRGKTFCKQQTVETHVSQKRKTQGNKNLFS